MDRYPIAPVDRDRWVIKGTHGALGTGNRYEFCQTSGPEVRFTIDNDAITKSRLQVDNAMFVTGEWVHVVLVRDAVNDLLSMYIDGILMTSGTDNSGDISSGEDMRIGNTTVGNGRTCEADIDDVRIFPSALTEDQIAAIY